MGKKETVHQLLIDFKKVYDSSRRGSCLIFSLSLVSPWNWIINMCLNGTCSSVLVGKNFSEMFLIRNVLKQGDILSPLLFNFALE